jgi:hypothetical protein
MKETTYGLMLALVLITTGCVPLPLPGHRETSPEITGRLVDADTKNAISNATIMVWAREDDAATSDDDGTFLLHAGQDFYVFKVVTPCPVYYFPPPQDYEMTIVIRHPAYEGLIIDVFDAYMEDVRGEPIDIGIIQLTPRETSDHMK